MTPGHSLDGMSIYDATERRLYVGDLIQPHVPTMMGPDADWNQWNRTLGKLISLVDDLNEEAGVDSVPNTPSVTPGSPAITLSPRLASSSPATSQASIKFDSPRALEASDSFLPKSPLPLSSLPAAIISTPPTLKPDWGNAHTLQRYQTMTSQQLEELASSLGVTKPHPNHNAGRVILACGHGHQPTSAGEDAARALRIMAGLSTGVRGVVVAEFTSDGARLQKGEWIHIKDQQHEKFGVLALKSIVPESVISRWKSHSPVISP